MAASHDVDVANASPVKQHPYRLNPIKAKYMTKETQYMLEHIIIEPSSSNWSSPCNLVPKPDKTFEFVQILEKLILSQKRILILYQDWMIVLIK
mgnify:CR=1 FL=1